MIKLDRIRGRGGLLPHPLPYTERGNGSLISVPSRLPKGGQRWDNASEIGGVVYG